MSTEPKPTFLVINAIANNRTGFVNDLTRIVAESGCNIEDSRMLVLGETFAVIMLTSGKWNAVAKLETQLETLASESGAGIRAKRTTQTTVPDHLLPYSIDVVAMDQPGIVHRFTRFFAQRTIPVQELMTHRYSAAHTATPMVSVHINIGIPAATHLAALRDEFLDFCDQLNVDAIMEPIKP